ncbi:MULTISPECIES: hypothetical protein [Paraburkholderia]|jgi:hypothetical protein|uniref:Uncharacterized protein n=1 Tax=Paraburkholderia largidicola TaxID=3014751 RepID=A0A7I8BZB0_9BURK|nr:hypothetical protein [Paraburkholderia sp. PGU16]BCF93973.1 hypothetical protein PPGU16_70400 [Paraburkholderia sp. PGU16]
MSTTESISTEELALRNKMLRDASAIALDTVQRYQQNLKKIRAVRRATALIDTADADHYLLIDVLGDLVQSAELEVDGELLLLELQLGRVNEAESDKVNLSIVH